MNLLFFGKPLGGRRPASARLPIQPRIFALKRSRCGPNCLPGQAFRDREDLDVRDRRRPCSAAAARPCRAPSPAPGQREDQQLAVLADDRDVVARRPARRGSALAGASTDISALPLRVPPTMSSCDDRRSRVRRPRPPASARARLVGQHGRDVLALVDVGHEPDRLASAAAAGQLARPRA